MINVESDLLMIKEYFTDVGYYVVRLLRFICIVLFVLKGEG